MKKNTKLFNIDIKSIDEKNRQITFCFSDDKEDRQGEIVDQGTWDVKDYMLNPVILWGHNPDEPENVLGQAVSLDLNNNGKSFVTAQFDDDDINPKAGMVFRQLVKRTLRTVSAGFRTHSYEMDGDVPILKENELFEISVVPIPANPRAMTLALRDGSMSRKDATYLIESMKKESELLEKQLKKGDVPDGMNEKDMDELNAKIDSLTNLLGSAVEKITAQDAALAELTKLVTPAEETEEEKTAREAKEAEAAKAEAEAKEAEAKAAAEKEEADKKAAEEAANGGGNDQSGAEFNEDAELTPEQEAELDAMLAESLAKLEPAQ